MAANEPNKPDNVINIDPGNKTQAEEKTAPDQPLQAGGEAPAPEVTGAEMKKPAEPDKTAPPPAPGGASGSCIRSTIFCAACLPIFLLCWSTVVRLTS